MTLKWYLCKRMSLLFLLLLYIYTSLVLYWHPVLFLSGFNASCECHHKAVFPEYLLIGKRKRIKQNSVPYGRGEASGSPLPEWLQSRCSLQGRRGANGRKGLTGCLQEHLRLQFGRTTEQVVTRAVSFETWPPQFREKPKAAWGKAGRVPRRWTINIYLAHAKLSTNSSFSPPSPARLQWINFLIFFSFLGRCWLHFVLIIQFCFRRRALKKCRTI